MPLDISNIIAGIGLGAGIVSVYVRLSLPNYTVTVLNGRYPTRSDLLAASKQLNTEITSLKELITQRLDSLPCDQNCKGRDTKRRDHHV